MFTTQEQYQLHQIERKRRTSQSPFRKIMGRIQALGAYSTNPIGPDVSHWQPNVDWQYLSKYCGFGIAKCAEVLEEIDPSLWYDKTFANNIDGMYKANIPALAYIFCNSGAWGLHSDYTLDGFRNLPTNQDLEYMKLAEVLTNKMYYGIVLDLERYWRYYNQYLEYLNGNRKFADVEVISSNWIFASFKLLIEHIWMGMKAREIRTVPIFIYSAPWFMTYLNSGGTNLFYDWAKKLEAADIRIHIASYTAPSVVASWEDVRSKYLPSGVPDRLGMTGLPVFWQFSGGSIKVPNGRYPNNGFDLNLSLLSKDDLYSWINYTKPAVSSPSSSPSISVSASISSSQSPSSPNSDTDIEKRLGILEDQVAVDIIKIDRIEDHLSKYPNTYQK